MRSHRFIKILLYLVIKLVAKESQAKAGIRRFFILFIDKRYTSQATFTLLLSRFYPFLSMKTLPVHITPFSNKYAMKTISVHIAPAKQCC